MLVEIDDRFESLVQNVNLNDVLDAVLFVSLSTGGEDWMYDVLSGEGESTSEDVATGVAAYALKYEETPDGYGPVISPAGVVPQERVWTLVDGDIDFFAMNNELDESGRVYGEMAALFLFKQRLLLR